MFVYHVRFKSLAVSEKFLKQNLLLLLKQNPCNIHDVGCEYTLFEGGYWNPGIMKIARRRKRIIPVPSEQESPWVYFYFLTLVFLKCKICHLIECWVLSPSWPVCFSAPVLSSVGCRARCFVHERCVGARPSLCGDLLLHCTPQHPVGCLATVSVHGNRGNKRPRSSSKCTLQLSLNCGNQDRSVAGQISVRNARTGGAGGPWCPGWSWTDSARSCYLEPWCTMTGKQL